MATSYSDRKGLKRFWLGTQGPHLYDPDKTYKDGEKVRAFRGDVLEVLAQVMERGDILVGLTSDTAYVLPRGTAGQVLVVNPFAPAGVQWADLVSGVPDLTYTFVWLSPEQYILIEAVALTRVWLSPEQYIEVFPQTLAPLWAWLSPEQYITIYR